MTQLFRIMTRWLTSSQAAAELGVSVPEMFSAMYGGRLRVRVRRMGGDSYITSCRILRFDRDSLNWSGLDLEPLTDEEYSAMDEKLPSWVTIKQAAEYYQISERTVRKMISIGDLKAKRIGPKTIRIERDSLVELGEYGPRRRHKGRYDNRL
ncbi:helix-turn-helix domain-containing protein [Mycobacterium sp. 2YAF39]|uniref:helix-turn-helix domain-containing protein n=1 Tax=Mycobacterium sp. 2YAF39 TaxID=3233033 RepID=UPI003F9C2BC9